MQRHREPSQSARHCLRRSRRSPCAQCGGRVEMQPPRARMHIPPMGVFGAVTTAGRPLSPLSAARASPVAARRRGSCTTSPRLYPPTRRGRACAAAARAQHLGGPTSPASPSILFTWWVFDRRRAHPGSTRACARGRPDRVRVAGHRPCFSARSTSSGRAAPHRPHQPPAGGRPRREGRHQPAVWVSPVSAAGQPCLFY